MFLQVNQRHRSPCLPALTNLSCGPAPIAAAREDGRPESYLNEGLRRDTARWEQVGGAEDRRETWNRCKASVVKNGFVFS